MVFFKYLIFLAFIVYTVAVEDGERVKKHAYTAVVRTPVWSHSAAAPTQYSHNTHHRYKYPTVPYHVNSYPKYSAYHEGYANYPAATSYSSYRSYAHGNRQYWPAKQWTGNYWSGKYEKTYIPVYKTVYPYHHY